MIFVFLNFFFLSFPPLSQCQYYREHASVLENQPSGTFVLQAEATDADEGANGIVKYGLMHRDGVLPAFSIHPDTGKANVRTDNDTEKPPCITDGRKAEIKSDFMLFYLVF